MTDHGHGRIIVRSLRRNQAFIDDLKEALPYRSMEWSPAGQRWFIDRVCRARVEAIGRRHFESVEIQEGA